MILKQKSFSSIPPKPEICLISGTYPFIKCGIGDYTAHLARALAAISVSTGNISVITSNQAAASQSGPVAINPVVTRWNWSSARTVLRYLLATRPAVVHFQYPTALYGRHPAITLLPWFVRWAALFRPDWSPACVVTIHEYATFRLLGKIRICLMALPCQGIIVVSPETLKSFGGWRNINKRLRFIPVGSNITSHVPPAYITDPPAWRAACGLKAGIPVIAYFGFISPGKGLMELVEAFSWLETEAQLLFIAGPAAQDNSFKSYVAGLLDLIKAKGLEHKVLWTGYIPQSEVAAYLRSATLAVFPFTEGAGLRRTSLLAALANGVPVITTIPVSNLAAAELIDRQNSRLIPPGDVQALKMAMEELLADPDLRQTLSENGLKLSTKFDWPAIANCHLNFYNSLK